MKKILLSSLVAAAAAVPAFAGVSNLNYQAVIKNGGNVLVDQQVNLKFELLDNSDKVVFTEVQSPKTNGAGYVACQLGQENDLSELNWGDLKLRVSIDLGSGYQVFSTEEVSSVPTALYALKSADSDMIIDAVQGLMADVEMNTNTLVGVNAELARMDGFIEDVENFNNDLSEKLEPMMGLNYEEIMDYQDRNTKDVIALNDFKEAAEESLQAINDELAKLQGLDYAEVMDYQDRNTKDVIAVSKEVEELNTNVEAFAEMVEGRFDKIQGQVDLMMPEVENLVSANEETQSKLNSFSADIAQIEGLADELDSFKKEYQEDFQKMSEVSAEMSNAVNEVITATEGLVQANEETQAKLNSFGADIARIEGIAEELESVKEKIDNLNSVSAVVYANQQGVEENKAAIAELKDTLDQLIEALRDLDILPTAFK